MNKCLSCKFFSLREIPAMSKFGFGYCPIAASEHPDVTVKFCISVSASRPSCERFDAADAATVAKRAEWLEAQE
jgi:hypothetical protein